MSGASRRVWTSTPGPPLWSSTTASSENMSEVRTRIRSIGLLVASIIFQSAIRQKAFEHLQTPTDKIDQNIKIISLTIKQVQTRNGAEK